MDEPWMWETCEEPLRHMAVDVALQRWGQHESVSEQTLMRFLGIGFGSARRLIGMLDALRMKADRAVPGLCGPVVSRGLWRAPRAPEELPLTVERWLQQKVSEGLASLVAGPGSSREDVELALMRAGAAAGGGVVQVNGVELNESGDGYKIDFAMPWDVARQLRPELCWLDIEDERPTDGAQVLFVDAHGDVRAGKFYETERDQPGHFWDIGVVSGGGMAQDVRLWQPYPNPPVAPNDTKAE